MNLYIVCFGIVHVEYSTTFHEKKYLYFSVHTVDSVNLSYVN